MKVKIMFANEILKLFKSVVITPEQFKAEPHFFVDPRHGYATNFYPNMEQQAALQAFFNPLPLTTLFTVEERRIKSPVELIRKQVLDYLATYGLNTPGIFNLEVTTGTIITFNFVNGISVEQLRIKLKQLLVTNAPVKDAPALAAIVKHYNVEFDINEVVNNELRVILFDANKDTFTSGDDAVRYICFKASGNSLLIKSPEVINSVKALAYTFEPEFLERHKTVLAQVFNRHKRIIMSLKTDNKRSVINAISRLSKKAHVPVHEGFSKRFISAALNGNVAAYTALDKISIRDHFKYLNILEHKLRQSSEDVFVIRNGKSHLESNRPVYSRAQIEDVQNKVIESLRKHLGHLQGRNILLDPNVNYGLPISRKQALGNLPFGTKITVNSGEISTGIYWENAWGATDLDLSAIDVDGGRVGWGYYSGYADRDIIFSGDITYAPNGAMEFLTSRTNYDVPYGLLVNAYSGVATAGLELVIGKKTDDQWIENPIVREKHNMPGRGSILGFVKDGAFVVYAPAVSASHVSSSKNRPIVQRGVTPFWTIRDVFDKIGLRYDLNRVEGKNYHYDLSYSNFSLDKLEELF